MFMTTLNWRLRLLRSLEHRVGAFLKTIYQARDKNAIYPSTNMHLIDKVLGRKHCGGPMAMPPQFFHT